MQQHIQFFALDTYYMLPSRCSAFVAPYVHNILVRLTLARTLHVSQFQQRTMRFRHPQSPCSSLIGTPMLRSQQAQLTCPHQQRAMHHTPMHHTPMRCTRMHTPTPAKRSARTQTQAPWSSRFPLRHSCNTLLRTPRMTSMLTLT